MADLVMFDGKFADRPVFVTGHTGFKGAWLAHWLVRLGADVTGYSLEPPTQPNLFEAVGLASRVRHIVADVRDGNRLATEIAAARPEIVFHLAAQSIVRLGYAKPEETFATNVMGTLNVLEAVRTCDAVRAVVVVTSDKCYQKTESGRPFREDDPMGGLDPYSASKGCAELIIASYRASFYARRGAARVASVRAGNVIGGGDWAADRIVPDCVRALSAGRPVVVRNPNAVRPWQHVLEPLSGYLRLASLMLNEDRALQEPWNFGPRADDGRRPVRWVVERFIEEWGTGSWVSPAPAQESQREVHWLQVDSSKARERLGWAPVWDVAAAVRQTATWYREFYRSFDVSAATQLVDRQLDDYHAVARDLGLAWAAGRLEAAKKK